MLCEYIHEGLWKQEWWGGKGAFQVQYMLRCKNFLKLS